MEVGKIMFLAVTQEHFEGERDGYARGDKGMSTIFVEL